MRWLHWLLALLFLARDDVLEPFVLENSSDNFVDIQCESLVLFSQNTHFCFQPFIRVTLAFCIFSAASQLVCERSQAGIVSSMISKEVAFESLFTQKHLETFIFLDQSSVLHFDFHDSFLQSLDLTITHMFLLGDFQVTFSQLQS